MVTYMGKLLQAFTAATVETRAEKVVIQEAEEDFYTQQTRLAHQRRVAMAEEIVPDEFTEEEMTLAEALASCDVRDVVTPSKEEKSVKLPDNISRFMQDEPVTKDKGLELF